MTDSDLPPVDPRYGLARIGEPVRIGTAIAYQIEPDELLARLVGIIRPTASDTPVRYVLREYVAGDGWFPTGPYFTTTTFIGLVPWTGTSSSNRSRTGS